MSNVLDYVSWRGDVTFESAEMNEVDNLIFCLLSYVDLDGIVPDDPRKGSITLRQAALEYFFSHDAKAQTLGLMVPADIIQLFHRMAEVPRYRDLELTGFVNEICEQHEMQFAALTIRLPHGDTYVAFRGTDDTIVGWREDFNLSYMDEVPSQRKAADYLNRVQLEEGAALDVGGHSKGGNLAVWAAVHADESIRGRIRHIYSNDGPGFLEETVQSKAFLELEDRMNHFIPQSSLVGLLLGNSSRYDIVTSDQKGLLQHNGLSWQVVGCRFVRAEKLSAQGTKNDEFAREHIDQMNRREKEILTQFLFGLLETTGAKTLTELHETHFKSAMTMLRTYTGMTRDEKELLSYLLRKLFDVKETAVTVQISHDGEEAVIRAPETIARRAGIHVRLFPLRDVYRRRKADKSRKGNSHAKTSRKDEKQP